MQHISSREALSALNDRLVSETSSASVDELEKLGDELLGVAGVLIANPVLRRTLTESSTELDGRARMVRSIFDGKVSSQVVELLDDAVRRPWASGADLREAVQRLGRTALFLSAEREDRLDRVEDELFRFGRIVEGSPELSVVLDDPAGDPQARVSLVTRLLDGRADRLTIALLNSSAGEVNGRSFSHRIRDLVDQAAERRNELVADVTAAASLDSSQQQRLSAALERIYGRPVAVHIEVDPALLGGMRIKVGEEVIDGSAAGRLAALGRSLG